MGYKVIYAYYDSMSSKPSFEDAVDHVSTAVNKAMADGWEPAGGIAFRVEASSRYQYVVQAMMKRDATSAGMAAG